VSATSVALSAALVSAAVTSNSRSAADRSGLRRDRPAGAGSRLPFPGRRDGVTVVTTAAPVNASRTATAAAGASPVASPLASTGPVM
jgi:hypothetical protein